MSTIQFSNGQKVQFSGNPSQKDIEEIAAKMGIGSTTPPPAPAQQSKGFLDTVASGAKAVGSALISSEKAFGQDIAAAIGGKKAAEQITQSNQDLNNSDLAYIKVLKDAHAKAVESGNQKEIARNDNLIKNFTFSNGRSVSDIFPALAKSNGQVVGDAAGVLLDILSAGTYGNAAKGAQTGQLLTSSANKVALAESAMKASPFIPKSVVAKDAATAAKTTLGTIAKTTAKTAAVGAGTGYAYDVSQNLQAGKTGTDALAPGAGALVGGALPIAIGGFKAIGQINKDTAPRIINSLVKPKEAQFAYGKDPGRTVAALGITGNNLEDFANNVHNTKNDIGSLLGDIYASPENAHIQINAEKEIAKIDTAIEDAAKGGKNNQGIVTTLQNIKDSLLHSHGIDAEGNIIRTSVEPHNLTNLNPQEAFNLKNEIAKRTQFTGRPSDDKTINSVLQDIYGGMKEQLNTALSVNNPEIRDLNQKFADLTSAEIAIRNRDKIIQRSNIAPFRSTLLAGSGVITALSAGTAAIPTVLLGASAVGLEKALGSTAAKTRVAAWLGKETPGRIAQVLQKNPAIKTVLIRTYPNLASKLLAPESNPNNQVQP